MWFDEYGSANTRTAAAVFSRYGIDRVWSRNHGQGEASEGERSRDLDTGERSIRSSSPTWANDDELLGVAECDEQPGASAWLPGT